MNKKKMMQCSIFIMGCLLIIISILYPIGARINTSNSIAEGLYWASSNPMAKGEYVIFCPPKQKIFDEAMQRGYITAGFCPGGYGYMMKQIAAVKGDLISESAEGVFVNGKFLVDSKPFAQDGAGRQLPILQIRNHIIGKDEILLMTDRSPISFDGRYFGTIKQSQIKSVIRPIVTW